MARGSYLFHQTLSLMRGWGLETRLINWSRILPTSLFLGPVLVWVLRHIYAIGTCTSLLILFTLHAP